MPIIIERQQESIILQKEQPFNTLPLSRSSTNSSHSTTCQDFLAQLDIEDRDQEVKAHVGQVQYDGIEEPIFLAQDLKNGCGGKIWEAANVMVNYLIWKEQGAGDIMRSPLLKGKKILELGAGTGLVGLAVAKLCPSITEMMLTDQLPMMNLMKENITLNKLDSIVKTGILNWGEQVPSEMLNADIILASDCIYLEVAFIPLIDTLFALTAQKPTDTVIYLAYRKRRSADKRFFQLAKKKFVFEEVTDDPRRPEYQKQNLHLFLVRRKQSNSSSNSSTKQSQKVRMESK